MRLTDTKIKAAKRAPKTFRISDGGGLYLEITPSGTRTFRFRYYRPDNGKRGWMNFGLYPRTKRTEARDPRDVFRVKVRHGEDPAAQRAKPAESSRSVAHRPGYYGQDLRGVSRLPAPGRGRCADTH